MPRHHLLPRPAERGRVQVALQAATQLLEVSVAVRRVQAVEEQALLQGRQRVDVLHAALPPQQPVQPRLVQARQREVRGHVAPRLCAPAVLDQLPQRRHHAVRQRLHRGAVVPARVVRPGQLQPSLRYPGVDLQQVRAPLHRTTDRADRLVRQGHAGLCRQAPVQLAQVVEAQLRLWQGPQLLGNRFVPGQVLQQPVAQAPLRHAPQLPLDCPCNAWLGPAAGGSACSQQHRVQGGEPADGARQNDDVEQFLAAVAFQVHQQPAAAAPAGAGQGQAGQEHVVDVGAVDGGHLLQELAAAVNSRLNSTDSVWASAAVSSPSQMVLAAAARPAAGRDPARRATPGAGRRSGRTRPGGASSAARRWSWGAGPPAGRPPVAGRQSAGPPAGHARKHRRRPGDAAPATAGRASAQIEQEIRARPRPATTLGKVGPRGSVRRAPVRPAGAQVEQDRAEQRALRQVEAGLGLDGGPLQGGRLLVRGRPRQINRLHHDVARFLGVAGGPGVTLVREAQPQGVVVLLHQRQGHAQHIGRAGGGAVRARGPG